METVIMIGLGEVSNPLYEIFKSNDSFKVYGYDARKDVSPYKFEELPKNQRVLHIAYPYSEGFVNTSLGYINALSPKAIVINSTVIPGTSKTVREKTGIPTAYSPVRGKHLNLKRHLMFWPKWISSHPSDSLSLFVDHLIKAGFKVKVAYNPETLEIAKLFETVYRAVMMTAWQKDSQSVKKI
jgi:UDP-N-acetyl-D-mannosaminuronate dehydrogenase